MAGQREITDSVETDEHAIARVLAGDRDAFEVLLRRYSRSVFTAVARRVPHDMVESVAQDVFISAFRSLGQYEPQQPFEHWLLRIARRRCCDHWRRRSRQRETPDTALSVEQWRSFQDASTARSLRLFEEVRHREEAQELVQRALGQLDAEDRTLIECIYFEQLPLAEVAATLEWSLPKVKVRAFRARKKLREIIESTSHREGITKD